MTMTSDSEETEMSTCGACKALSTTCYSLYSRSSWSLVVSVLFAPHQLVQSTAIDSRLSGWIWCSFCIVFRWSLKHLSWLTTEHLPSSSLLFVTRWGNRFEGIQMTWLVHLSWQLVIVISNLQCLAVCLATYLSMRDKPTEHIRQLSEFFF